MTPTGQPDQAGTPRSTDQAPGRVLLAYFSRPGENYYYGDRITLEVGNTQRVADLITATTSVDVYQIEAADPYPADYEKTVARNVQEENDDARPAIAHPLPDVARYDVVLLGCPVWNVQTPMIMRTFVEAVDLEGKTLHPFVTYAVSGIGRVESDYARLCPDTVFGESLAVLGETAQQARPDVEAWLRRIGL
ncbi:flavodoxin [Promicromonospora sp. AC04]|uniref:flavodoxin n=1 Tax=Promicromonospora sp. AC04 TaxID=2135723 RepID=UPI000D37796E|nr:flavodoxin [Promicromonospora sp. AC04]PUB20879.1 flavodoxin [Promicromonospora sp. AC04]